MASRVPFRRRELIAGGVCSPLFARLLSMSAAMSLAMASRATSPEGVAQPSQPYNRLIFAPHPWRAPAGVLLGRARRLRAVRVRLLVHSLRFDSSLRPAEGTRVETFAVERAGMVIVTDIDSRGRAASQLKDGDRLEAINRR